MKSNRKSFGGAIALATLSAALLAACGGGGDGGGVGGASSDPIDKYLGTYTGQCQQSIGVADATTGKPVYEVFIGAMTTKASASKATGTIQGSYYDKSDCSGTARYTVKFNTADNFINIDGSATVDGKTVDKITLGTGVYFPGTSFGNSFTLNGLKFTGSPYNQQTPATSKDLFWLDSQGALFYGDFSKPLDAQGYPTALEAKSSVAFKPS